MTDPIWTPSKEQVEGCNLYAFMQRLKGRRGFPGGDWPALHRWSVEHMEAFWEEAWLDAQECIRSTIEALKSQRKLMEAAEARILTICLDFAEKEGWPTDCGLGGQIAGEILKGH